MLMKSAEWGDPASRYEAMQCSHRRCRTPQLFTTLKPRRNVQPVRKRSRTRTKSYMPAGSWGEDVKVSVHHTVDRLIGFVAFEIQTLNGSDFQEARDVCMERIHQAASSAWANAVPTAVLVDDNMFYRSMRKKVLLVARSGAFSSRRWNELNVCANCTLQWRRPWRARATTEA